jgi:hypothetical protein
MSCIATVGACSLSNDPEKIRRPNEVCHSQLLELTSIRHSSCLWQKLQKSKQALVCGNHCKILKAFLLSDTSPQHWFSNAE